MFCPLGHGTVAARHIKSISQTKISGQEEISQEIMFKVN